MRRRLRAPDPLVDGDVLADEARDLVGLLGLDARDALLHQVAALHVQEQRPVLRLHLPRRYHLKEGQGEGLMIHTGYGYK